VPTKQQRSGAAGSRGGSPQRWQVPASHCMPGPHCVAVSPGQHGVPS
jgi:hypothetical protein